MTEHFVHSDVTGSIEAVKELSVQSSMRRVNAQRASKMFKQYVAKNGDEPLDKEAFVDFMIDVMKKYDFCDTLSEQEIMREGFDDVF